MATLQVTLTPEIEDFCRREGVEDTLRTAVDLVRQYFSDANGLRTELMWDPDNPGDVWVSLVVTVSGAAADYRDRDDAFLRRWIAEVAWPQGDKVVMTLDIV